MSVSVTLPALGESVTEGTVTRWLKQVGDSVDADEPLLEVSTDKVDTEIPSPAAGTLLSITAAEDQTVEVGAELGVIGSSQDAVASSRRPTPGPPADRDANGSSGPSDQPVDEPAASGHSTAAEVPGGQSGALPAAGAPPAPVEADSHADQLRDSATSQQRSGDGQSAGSPSGVSVTLPELGESVTEGTVTRWLKQVGDSVAADEPLLEVSTDKVDTEIPSPAAGTLLSITAAEDQTVAVGAELGVIGAPSAERAPAGTAPQPAAPAAAEPELADQPEPAVEPGPAAEPEPAVELEPAREPIHQAPAAAGEPAVARTPPPAAPPAADGGNPYVTPLVRKLAADSGVDLATVSGTGVGGRIRKQDLLDAAETARAAAAAEEQTRAAEARAAAEARTGGEGGAEAAPAEAAGPRGGGIAPAVGSPREPVLASSLRGTTEKLSRLRKVIATRMVESLQISAQLTTVVEVDVTAVARMRQRAKAAFEQREGVKLSFLPFFALATVEALKVMPKLNATLDTDAAQVTYAPTENLGVAVDTERGLLVPVITDAGDLNLAGLARKIADLAARTRTNKLAPDELAGGTFTLTNTGSRGALFDTPILNQPQVGILGTGAVVKRPMVVDVPGVGETIAIRSMAYLSLTYDHRLVDGADAARFLVLVKNRIEDGAFEADLGL